MKVATYNINSIRARADNLFSWLKKHNPDVVFLQEIKCETENFLFFECESLGYKVAVCGQKGYNGVAILCKYDFILSSQNLPNYDDDAARYVEVIVTYNEKKFYAASVYAPNGCSLDKVEERQKLLYKLNWFDKFYEHILQIKNSGLPIILGGDFNVMMNDIDVFDANRFKNSPLYIKDVQNKILALNFVGLHDAFRLIHPNIEGYTFWDYSANSFVTNSGLRIDYLLLSAHFAEKLISCAPDKSLRMMDKPSDHTVLVAEFEV